ncbi:MAG: hypothetical protein Q8R02_11970 [Hyphomonadaceae bacterium]|nr:hypothetical protein [Hyphomonadaceae bacterium]
MRLLLILLIGLFTALPALAQTSEDETKIRAVIADWYKYVGEPVADPPWGLMAPGGVDAGPGFAEIPRQPPEYRSAAAYDGPRINNELAAKAMQFAYDIDTLKIDPRFAKVWVWERGYFYAWAAQKTYENAASTLFVLEKHDDGRWLILLHDANSQGIPPNKITDPLPDLRALYYSRCGSACDPEADAKKAKEF